MDVQDIIQLIANQGLGNDTPTPADQVIYLRYLNIAHDDLYRSVKILDPDRASISTQITVTDGQADLPGDVMQIVSAIRIRLPPPQEDWRALINPAKDGKLVQKTLGWIESRDPMVSQTGDPEYYYLAGNKIGTYPVTTHLLKIRYIPKPQPFTLQTLASQIPYPPEYHSILVDGALFYLFQGEGGFKSGPRARDAQLKWLRGKTSLCNFIEATGNPREKIEDF